MKKTVKAALLVLLVVALMLALASCKISFGGSGQSGNTDLNGDTGGSNGGDQTDNSGNTDSSESNGSDADSDGGNGSDADPDGGNGSDADPDGGNGSDADSDGGNSSDADANGGNNGGDSTEDQTPERPDYGTSTVYLPGDKINFITSVYSSYTSKIKEELERVVGKGNVISGSIYLPNQPLEVLFNPEEDDSRPAIAKANKLLETLERPAYFSPRYVVYASGGTIAVAFDNVDYTNLVVGNHIAEEFIEKCLAGRDQIAFAEGIIASGSVDLIAIQEELDAENDAAAWKNFKDAAIKKYGEETGNEFYDAFKTYYSIFSDDLYMWYANLYDPGVGGFYASSSGRDSAGFLPLVETTGQIWGQLVGMGLFKETGKTYGNALPTLIKCQMVYFLKSCQDENGFFYPPQMSKVDLDKAIASRSRNTSRATSCLASLGSSPVYDTPLGARGDGITADQYWDNMVDRELIDPSAERPYVPTSYSDYVSHVTTYVSVESAAQAVSKIVQVDSTSESMKYLENHQNFAAYLNGLNIDGSPYVVGNELNATYTMIANAGKSVGKCEAPGYWYSGMDYKEMTITWLNSKINCKGLFGYCDPNNTDPYAGCKYINTNGFFKIMSVYNSYGYAYPEPELAARGCLLGIMSDEESKGNICETYNIWEGFGLLINNVKNYADAEMKKSILSEIDEAMSDYGPEAVINSYNKQKRYQKDDGGFAHNISKGQTSYQGGVNVGTGVNEANVDANGFGSYAIINAMLDCIGLASYEVQIYRHGDYMKFIQRLMELQPVVKGVRGTESSPHGFDEMPEENFRLTVADEVKNSVGIVTDKALGSSGNKVLQFTKTSTDSGMNAIVYSAVTSENANCAVYEVDLLYSSITQNNVTEISIGSVDNLGVSDKLIYITLTPSGAAKGSKILYSDGENGVSRGQNVDTGAAVGSWFSLRVEVYSDGTVDGFYYKTFVNDRLIYVSRAIYGTNLYSGATPMFKASEIDRASCYFCYGFTGEFRFDNMGIYQTAKQR